MESSYSQLIKHIEKLQEHDPSLRQRLVEYCYPIQGACQEVHRQLGPFLNEYMYQEALDICLREHGYVDDNKIREYYFSITFHGQEIRHRHFVDFYINKQVFVECKAVEALGTEQRQQLWNYMRLTNTRLGILYNFAPIRDQCERYYYDVDNQIMYMW